jgi:Polyprenyl synthetase
MVSENFQSPNAIPIRTSSTGITNLNLPAAKPVLRPVPEGDWIASNKHSRSRSNSSFLPGFSVSRMFGQRGSKSDGTSWSKDKEKILLGPYDYLFDQPGKDIRKQLISAFNSWLKVPPESLEIITKVVGMLHTASLLFVGFRLLCRYLLTNTPSESTMSKTPRSYVVVSLSLTAYLERLRRSTLQTTSTFAHCKSF